MLILDDDLDTDLPDLEPLSPAEYLRSEYEWLAAGGTPFETIARQLGRTPEALERALPRAGVRIRCATRIAVDHALAQHIARGRGHVFNTLELPDAPSSVLGAALRCAQRDGLVLRARKIRGEAGVEWTVL